MEPALQGVGNERSRTKSATTAGRPLTGVTVVSFEQAVAAPLATRHLADLGARVIKIERPGAGDFAREYDHAVKGLSSHFVWTNRSKESLTLNLKHPGSHEIMRLLFEKADVVVQNLSPRRIESFGLEPAELQKRHPGLIVCRISGYGDNGPDALRKAYDLLIQCEAGLLAVTGTEDEPAKVGIPVADIAAGMYAFSGILAALYARSRSGRGEVIEISLLESLAEWMTYPSLFALYQGSAPPRTGTRHATIAPYGTYRTADSELVLLAVQNSSEWERFCDVVLNDASLATDPRFATNEDRIANFVSLNAVLEPIIVKSNLKDLLEKLEAGDIAHTKFSGVEGLIGHPQLTARGRWTEVTSPSGPVQSLLPPINFAGSRPVMGAVPSLGEHTDGILADLGFSAQRILEFRGSGAV